MGKLLLSLLLSIPAAALLAGQSRPAGLDAAKWREDVRYFARELPRRHKNAFHTTPKEQFDRSIAELDAAIPSLEEHQIIVRLHQIAGAVGDGHTGVRLSPRFNRYPISLYWFGPDLRIIAAQKEYAAILGRRVVKIDGMDIAEVRARVGTCFPSARSENDWYEMSTSPEFIARPEVLHALGIVKSRERAAFTLEDDEGRESVVEIGAAAVPAAVNGVVNMQLQSAAKSQPLNRQRPNEPFWFIYLADSNTTYASFRSYDGLGQHARELFAALDRKPTSRLVIDLRQNGGGDFFEGRKHLVEPVKKRPALNQKGRVFIAVGRRTFSAAMVNAIDFRKETNAILVGEPIGERPNSYSENDPMTLPNSRLVVSYSTRYYKFLDEDVPAVEPDHRIDPTWPDFLAGRDAVMDWILSQPR
jgi:hypothetical protein